MSMQARRWRMAGPLLVAGLVLAGCQTGDDGEAPAGEDTQAASVEEFCETVVDAEMALGAGPDVDFEAASPEEIDEAISAFADEMNPMFDEATELAPDEISDEIDTLVRLSREGFEAGEPPFENPEFVEADAALKDFMRAECGFEQTDISAVEYAFEGVPRLVPFTPRGFTLINEGEEEHELVVFKLKEGVDTPIDELLAQPEEQAEEQVNFVGATFAEPGQSGTTFLDLEPGRYAVVCFVPVGSVPEEEPTDGVTEEASPTEAASPGGEEGEQEGPPHFTQGMFAEFEVTE